MEKTDRKAVVRNDLKCPRCGFDFREGDEYTADDFDDLMLTDFVADGELNGMF
jgi:hypothetical protein